MLDTIQEEKVDPSEKIFSFEEICPDWAQILADNGGFIENRRERFEAKDGNTKSIMNCASCLVGEAHGG